MEKAINWAATITWKGIKPVVHFWEKIYKKGYPSYSIKSTLHFADEGSRKMGISL